jgi:pimeloyl-ACP methyl ester carboxylesterase
MPQAVRHDYADLDGICLHYAAVGSGKLIVFLHGFPEFWYAWKDQLAEFGRDHYAVAPDLRGYNLSTKPPAVEDYALPHLVGDVFALADKLGHERFILVGHDWGGVVAWVSASVQPNRVSKLVIVNAPHPDVFARELRENPAQQQASQYMLLFRSMGAEDALAANNYERLVQGVLGDGLAKGTVTDEDRAAYLAAWSQPGALTGGLNYYRAAAVGPPTGSAAADAFITQSRPALRVNVPTLVIWGERDTALLTGNLNGLEAYVPDLTIKRIPEGSHWVIHEQPGLVNRYIREFIA